MSKNFKIIINHSTSYYFFCSTVYLCLIIFFAITCYMVIRHCKPIIKENEKNILLPLLATFCLTLYISAFTFLSIYYLFKGFYTETYSITASATLTVGAITAISLFGSLFGILYTNTQNKIQKLHSESNWRGRLLDLEKKPVYTTNDLLEINSFINPYHKKNDNLDYLISFAIKTIIETHLHPENNNNDEFLPFYRLVSDSKILSQLKEILQKDNPNVPNTFDYINTNEKSNPPHSEKNNEKSNALYSEENIVIRKCIHALLKNDWMNVNE